MTTATKTTITEAPTAADPIKEARFLKGKIDRTREELAELSAREDAARERVVAIDRQLKLETNWKARVRLGGEQGAAQAELEGGIILRASLEDKLSALCKELSAVLKPWVQDTAVPALRVPLASLNADLDALTALRDAAQARVDFALNMFASASMLASDNGAEWQAGYAEGLWPDFERIVEQLHSLEA